MNIIAHGKFPKGYRVGPETTYRQTHFRWLGSDSARWHSSLVWPANVISAAEGVYSAVYDNNARTRKQTVSTVAGQVAMKQGESDFTLTILGSDFRDDSGRPVLYTAVLVDAALRPEDTLDTLHQHMSWDYIVDPARIVHATLTEVGRSEAETLARMQLHEV